MDEITTFQLIVKGLISDLHTDEIQEYRNMYDKLKEDCSDTVHKDEADPKKLAVIMFAMDLIKEQMGNKGD